MHKPPLPPPRSPKLLACMRCGEPQHLCFMLCVLCFVLRLQQFVSAISKDNFPNLEAELAASAATTGSQPAQTLDTSVASDKKDA